MDSHRLLRVKQWSSSSSGVFRRAGLDPVRAVDLIVATHWHDDHIRGMAELVRECTSAEFCCSAAFRKGEFLAVVGSVEPDRILSHVSSGVRQIYEVFSILKERGRKPVFALADRRIWSREACEVRSLSPHDGDLYDALLGLATLIPDIGETKRRIPTLTPNKISIVLSVAMHGEQVLLGADLEAPGWTPILNKHSMREGTSSVFKVPHHGSAGAHRDEVWARMLDKHPLAVLTPWQLGGRKLPKHADIERILSLTDRAYSSARVSATSARRLAGVNQ